MTSPLMESIGLANLDVAYLFIGIIVCMIILLVLIIVQMCKLKKLKKKYARFMKGKDGKTLEKDIMKLFEEQDGIREENEKNRKEVKELSRRMEYAYQKVGIVKYDAFQQMGGKLSFCLALLNDKNNGFILNSVHSSEGCYSYVKEIKKGESDLSLGEEEKQALQEAMRS